MSHVPKFPHLILSFHLNRARKRKRKRKMNCSCPKKSSFILDAAFLLFIHAPLLLPFVCVNGSYGIYRGHALHSVRVYFIIRYIARPKEEEKKNGSIPSRLPLLYRGFVVSIKESITVNTREPASEEHSGKEMEVGSTPSNVQFTHFAVITVKACVRDSWAACVLVQFSAPLS